jgi:quercetin dioxygenase-like cupin family protein
MRVLLEAGALEGDVAVFELLVPPHTLGAPPHIHSREDESFYVLEGELVFLSGEEEIPAAAGTVANLPRGHMHGFWNASDAPARALLTITPSGFGEFFDEVVAELQARGLSDPREVGALLTEVARRHGCEIHGERIGPIMQRYGLH